MSRQSDARFSPPAESCRPRAVRPALSPFSRASPTFSLRRARPGEIPPRESGASRFGAETDGRKSAPNPRLRRRRAGITIGIETGKESTSETGGAKWQPYT